MKYKPWPIVCLAFLHLCAPFISFYLIYFYFDLTPVRYFQLAWQNSDIFSIFLHLTFPLAGIIIYQYKRWSLPAFWSLQLAAFIFNIIFILRANEQQLYQLSLVMMGLTILNLLITSYFLLPVVRQSFFDQSLHWWLVKERYRLEISTTVSKGTKSAEGTIVNISETGVLFQLGKGSDPVSSVRTGDKILLTFSLAQIKFQLLVTIVHYHAAKRGYGASFEPMSATEKKELHNLLKTLKLFGLLQTRDQDSRFNDFRIWLSKFSKGEGLVPEIKIKEE
jgi:hypothetical protein